MRKKRYCLLAAVVAVLLVIAGWRLPILAKIETLELPEGYKTIYDTKVQLSDIYWPHVIGEKVIQCDLGYAQTTAYIETHNSKWQLNNITVYEFAGYSDIAIYNPPFDGEGQEPLETANYIVIRYFFRFT